MRKEYKEDIGLKEQLDWDKAVTDKFKSELCRDFIVIPSCTTVRDAQLMLKKCRYVVIEHVLENKKIYYIFSYSDMKAKLDNINLEEPIKYALQLKEEEGIIPVTLTFLKQQTKEGILSGELQIVIDKDKIAGIFQKISYSCKAPRSPCLFHEALAGAEKLADIGDLTGNPSDAIASVHTSDNLQCHVGAEIPEEVVAYKELQVHVMISREKIEMTNTAVLKILPDKKITVRLIPKLNFKVINEYRTEVDVPEPNDSFDIFFDVIPTKVGEGEIWISFSQGPLVLKTIKLQTKIVQKQSSGDIGLIKPDTVVTPSLFTKNANTMMIHVMDDNGRIHYEYDLFIDSIDDNFKSDEFKNDNIEALLQPYMDFLSTVETDNKPDFDMLQLNLCSIGAVLFKQLFPVELQKVFWEKRKEIDHLKIYCEDSYIPWEMLYVCEPGKPLPLSVDENLFLGLMGLVRWLHGHVAPEVLKIRPGRSWYAIPLYQNNGLEYAKEEENILRKFFEAKAVEPATRLEVLKLLSKEDSFDLFHFAGHGKADETQISEALIALEYAGQDGNRMLKDLKPEDIDFANVLRDKDGIGAVIVLNACQVGRTGDYITKIGGFAPAFLEKQAGIFIGALWDIGDKPALAFINQFYQSLYEGKIVAEAVKEARRAAYKQGDATFLAYTVYANPFAHLVKGNIK